MTYADPELSGAPDRWLSAKIPRIGIVALLVAVSYYLGAKLGFALTLRPNPISTLWPPNTILLAALLLTPTTWWWLILLAALPAHLAIELNSGFPTPLVYGWFVSNSSEALIGAGLVRALIRGPLRFDRFRDVGIFIFCGAFLGTFISSFLDAAFVTWAGADHGSYWSLWRTRFLSNMLTSLTLGSVILTWARGGFAGFRAAPPSRYMEGSILALGLLAVSLFVFNGQRAGLSTAPVSLYAPLPFLLWGTIRFGPRATTASLLTVTFLAVWGAVHGHGPFLTSSPADNAVSIQMFLIVIAIPFLVLAAVIRERENTDSLSRENEERLNLALGAAEVGAWEYRIVDDQVLWSNKSKEIFGLSNPGVTTLAEFLSLVATEDRTALSNSLEEAILHGTPYQCEFRVFRQDSSLAWVLGKGKALYDDVGRPRRLLGVNVDITDRKLAEEMRREEETLRASEAELRELADAMPQIVWTSTSDGQVDYFNDRWYELTGSTVAAGTNDLLLMTHADDQQTVIDAWQHSVATGYPCQVEHRLRVGNSGEFRWHLLRAAPVRDAEGQVRRWYGSCTDIQDQKGVEKQLRSARLDLEARVFERTAELSSAVVRLRDEVADRVAAVEALRRSEERFAKAFHSSPDAIVIIRQSDFRIIEVNEKAEALFGYSRAEVLGRSYDDFGLIVQDDDRYLRRRLFEANGRLRELEADVRHKSGDVLRVVLVTDTMDMAGEACYIVIVRDITERKRADALLNEQQRELAHLSRVAALGELSGALAHELNQPLAAILSNARAAQRMIPADTQNAAEVREILEDIASDDRRAGEVISRMRTLLKKSDLQPRPVSLAEIVKEVLGLLHSDLIQRRVSVTSQVPASLPTVMGDRVQLQQVLLNLILNACDAMVQQPPTDRRLAIDAALTDEGAVQLSVRDWGVGISANRLEQIFDPFVTTKESGLGLGLAICRSIVTAHGGRLWAVNNSDRGATFRMSLTPAGIGSTVGVSAGEKRVLGGVNSQGRQ